MNEEFSHLLNSIHNCQACADVLPCAPRPILQADPAARILIAGQAPGLKAHNSVLPFDDTSGERLRQWLGVTRGQFYDATRFAIVPMGFCYPGRGKSGDLPPRKECAQLWHKRLLTQLNRVELIIVVGGYAQDWHFNDKLSVTQRVSNWSDYWPAMIPLPHPSPRNNIWLRRNPWFEEQVVPQMQERVAELI